MSRSTDIQKGLEETLLKELAKEDVPAGVLQAALAYIKQFPPGEDTDTEIPSAKFMSPALQKIAKSLNKERPM